MKILEQILEETEKRVEFVRNIPTSEDEGWELPDGEQCYEDGRLQGRYQELLWVAEIIRSHMEDDGWIPANCPPEKSLNSVIGWDEYRQRCCFVQYLGGRWMLPNDIDSVKIVAWRPLPESYRPKED